MSEVGAPRLHVVDLDGARTGEPRRNGVIYFHDGDRVVASSTRLDARRHGELLAPAQ